MLRIERHGDVLQLRMSTWRSRAAGLEVSAYMVRGVLVDTGFHRAAGALAAALDELAPRGAIVTHYHEDHAGNAPLLARRGLPLWLAPETAASLRARHPIRLYRRVVWGWPDRLASYDPLELPSGLATVHTPGHSADHHVVWDAETRTLFSGDLWLGVKSRIMHEAEDPYAIVASLRAVAALAPRRMFDAHRGLVDDPVGALLAKADWMTETIGAIADAVVRGWSDRAIVRGVLGGEERAAYASFGEYARRNFVRAVRRKGARDYGGGGPRRSERRGEGLRGEERRG